MSKNDSFWSRFHYFVGITDPRNIFLTEKDIKDADFALKNHKEGLSRYSEMELSRYRKIVDSSMHPVTGQIIPTLFRVSAIGPVNIPLVYAMLSCPSTNITGTLFLHWFNQSYNSACNFANRSGSNQTVSQIVFAYILATSSACGLAFSLGQAFNRAPPKIKQLGVIIPCLASSAANVSNISLTRMVEITEGTPVCDASGSIVGISRTAGLECVKQTAVTRCVLVPCACLLLPPLAMTLLASTRLMPSSPRGKLILELGIICCSLQTALPAALAIYPQKAEFDTRYLESQFHELYDGDGRRISRVFANKGL